MTKYKILNRLLDVAFFLFLVSIAYYWFSYEEKKDKLVNDINIHMMQQKQKSAQIQREAEDTYNRQMDVINRAVNQSLYGY